MTISTADWKKYIARLRRISDKAADEMQRWVQLHGFGDTDALIEYAWALATKYGEAAATAACDMFDAVAEASGKTIPGALPAETATFEETAKTINGTLRQGAALVSDAVGRLVKQAGADTTLQNAERHGAEFAWVPMGDTCAFCRMLASNGWQRQSKKAMKGGHAEHIHANCDCQYAVRFDGKGGVAGYDPDKYKAEYDAAEGDTWQEKLNSMRREQYKQGGEKIRAQKRAAYAARKSAAEGEKGIHRRTPGYGRPVDVAITGAPLNEKQKEILSRLTEYDSRATFNSRDVSMRDLSALSAHTGVEFAMFSRGSERLVIRGDIVSVNVLPEDGKKLAAQGYRWAGHTHPGNDRMTAVPSQGDRNVLREMDQELSSIYSSTGICYVFAIEEANDYGFRNIQGAEADASEGR